MKKIMKLLNVDVTEVMKRIVDAHTQHYKNDLNLDLTRLRVLSKAEDGRSRAYVWLCRTSGTWLFNEVNAVLRGGHEYNTCLFYEEQGLGKDVLAYIIEPTNVSGKKIVGNVFSIDNEEYCVFLRENALPTDVLIHYKNGDRILPVHKLRNNYDAEFGSFQSWEYQPKDADAVRTLTKKLTQQRSEAKEVNLDVLLADLVPPEKKAG